MQDIGIYKIENIINGKIYIGSSTQLIRRFKTHKERLLKNKHANIILQRSWNKYDEKAFIFTIIEYCTKENIVEREQYYLDSLKPYYNIAPIAYSSSGIIRRQETKDKIRQTLLGRIMSEETKLKISEAKKGINLSEITKRKMSENQKGKNNSMIKSGIGFDKQIEAMKKANTGKKRDKLIGEKIGQKLSKPVLQYDLQDNFIKEWEGASQVEKILGFNNSLINRVCSGKINSQGFVSKTAYNYKWKFK
jgi:group I intron endonuclease